MKHLPPRAEDVLAAIESYITEHDLPPTLRELMAATAISSTSVIAYQLNRLREAGLITYQPRLSRTIRLVVPADEAAA